LLIALPGAQAGAVAESLQAIARANEHMREHYLQQKAAFAQ